MGVVMGEMYSEFVYRILYWLTSPDIRHSELASYPGREIEAKSEYAQVLLILLRQD